VLAEAPPAQLTPDPPPITPPVVATGFARVKQILDGALGAWKVQHHEPNPDLTSPATHDHPQFGWQTKQQLINSAPLGFKLIEAGKPGKDTNLVKALRDATGVDDNGRMPRGGPFLLDTEIAEIVAWIDAGMLD
jgi:hypothetical protein